MFYALTIYACALLIILYRFRLATYAVLFGLKKEPFFGKSVLPLNNNAVTEKLGGTPKHKVKDNSVREIGSHLCTTSPEAVREEVRETTFYFFSHSLQLPTPSSLLLAFQDALWQCSWF